MFFCIAFSDWWSYLLILFQALAKFRRICHFRHIRRFHRTLIVFPILSNLELCRNFAEFAIIAEFAAFVGPFSFAHSLKSWTLTKFRRIRHLRRNHRFSPLSSDPSLSLNLSNLELWWNFAEIAIFAEFPTFAEFAVFVGPFPFAHFLKRWILAKFRRIPHFRHCVHFWTYLG